MLEFEGIVEELLPNANFRVKLIANDHVIIAHTAGKMREPHPCADRRQGDG